MEDLDQKVRSLIDEKLLDAYDTACDHLGTQDIILWLDIETGDLSAYPRTIILEAATELGIELVAKKFEHAAIEKAKKSTGSKAFWLIVMFSDSKAVGALVSAHRLSGGSWMLS